MVTVAALNIRFIGRCQDQIIDEFNPEVILLEPEASPTKGASAGMAKLIVTSRDLTYRRQTVLALKRAVPQARIKSTAFRAIFTIEAEADPKELAKRVYQECSSQIGHLTAVLYEVESSFDSIMEAAVAVGLEHIGEHEQFSFRLYKRGAHQLEQDTPKIEYEIGGQIWQALKGKYGIRPKVNLTDPEVAVIAEVLGPITAVGIWRKDWQASCPSHPDESISK